MCTECPVSADIVLQQGQCVCTEYLNQTRYYAEPTLDCVTACPNGQFPYQANYSCVYCDPACSKCTDFGINSCQECNNGYFNFKSTSCLVVCPDGYFGNLFSYECELCKDPCCTLAPFSATASLCAHPLSPSCNSQRLRSFLRVWHSFCSSTSAREMRLAPRTLALLLHSRVPTMKRGLTYCVCVTTQLNARILPPSARPACKKPTTSQQTTRARTAPTTAWFASRPRNVPCAMRTSKSPA